MSGRRKMKWRNVVHGIPFLLHGGTKPQFLLLPMLCMIPLGMGAAPAKTHHVWEKVEIVLQAEKTYGNPYTDVRVWVNLRGPGFKKRCYGFWDGGKTFRVRILADSAGEWSWTSGSEPPDRGLNRQEGRFIAVAWSRQEKEENPCRRGMVKVSANGHAFEYADGTPYFLLGDTWWPTGTFRFPWFEDDRERPIGPEAGFKDYVRYRQKQGFNCIALIAAFPNWANDGKPAGMKTGDGTELRGAWRQAGTNSAKDMRDEHGNLPFAYPGKVPGYESVFPDLDRIHPAFFQTLDRKIDYLNAHGFVPFIEVARRDIGPQWKKYYAWPDSYARYIQYVWSRYQANSCFFSPIHFDWDGSLPAGDFNAAANRAIEAFGHPPFGTLASCNPCGSSLENFGHVDKATWIGFHQIGNFHPDLGHGHRSYRLLTDMFRAVPPIPGINGEPYYDGQHETDPGSETAARYSRSAMYGSVLSGGLGGHIYGAGKEGSKGGTVWGGNVEKDAISKIWDGMAWPSGSQVQHLRTFVLSEGRKYMDLIPRPDLLSPTRSNSSDDWTGWATCAGTENKLFFLLYFEKDCRAAVLSGAEPSANYILRWFDPRDGRWDPVKPVRLRADALGRIRLPSFPDGSGVSRTDWALKLLQDGSG